MIDLEKAVAQYELDLHTCLHIGAHHGQEDATYQSLGIEPIYVEANPQAYQVLVQRLPGRECHQTAIADFIGQVDFHVTSNEQSSSILPLKKHKKIYPHILAERTIRVDCTTVDGLLGPRCCNIDLLNMDIQGAELKALQRATHTLPGIQCIVTEINRTELYAGCALVRDLDRFLRPYGFRRAITVCPYHRSWGDALYVKSPALSLSRRCWPFSGRRSASA